jgi:hypothetical protein
MSSLIVIVVVRILEGMFIIGSLGSAVVFVLTSIEDLKMLLGREDESSS